MRLTQAMDLVEVQSVRVAEQRSDLAFREGERPLGGGTWLYSEPQPGTTGLVDLTRLGWNPLAVVDGGLSIAATCTFETLAAMTPPPEWPAALLFAPACEALLGSWKIQRYATVGGNVCVALPAGPMTSLLSGLDAEAVIWGGGGSERRMAVAELVTDVRTTALRPDEVVRSFEVPGSALESRAAMRRLSLAELGRTAVFVVARLEGAGAEELDFVLSVTASTRRPWQFRFDGMPTSSELAVAIDTIDTWYYDPHGAPDWRRAMTLRLAEELRIELRSEPGATGTAAG